MHLKRYEFILDGKDPEKVSMKPMMKGDEQAGEPAFRQYRCILTYDCVHNAAGCDTVYRLHETPVSA